MTKPKVLETMARGFSFSRQHGRIDSDDLAQAALQALQETGYVVVPREPTIDMIEAYWDAADKDERLAHNAWKAMVSTFLEQGDQESFMSSGAESAARIASDHADQERVTQLENALRPFAGIVPSNLYPADGSESEQYVVILQIDRKWQAADFSGADLARAREALTTAVADHQGEG